MVGEGTELDKGLIEKITDPMTHLVRNSLDHGIEMPEARIAAGKPETGTITLSAYHRGGNIVIEVADDGGGLKRERILAKAQERGLPIPADPSDSEVWNLIFEPGFSTADVVTDVSGRGVGMDVVRRNISALGGSVEIDSAAGLGTRMTVRLPLTLAIMDGMSIAIGGETYILPLASVVESMQTDSKALRPVAGQGRVLDVRGEYLPVLKLADVFPPAKPVERREAEMVVIVEADGVKTALVVDELVGQHQVVVKSLETNYRRQPGISGATIMGDGRVALILDISALIKKSRH
jgi:two-component system, chemotaxis family, sensor kinase CheA